jgi:TctA family transporter
MESLISLGVEVLRVVPLILAFYIPALLGVVLLKERGEAYKVKAALVFFAGFGGIIALQLLFYGDSVAQATRVLALSIGQVAAALFFAALTVHKLAD